MPRYVDGQIDWDRYRADLRRYQRTHGLNNAALARRLHVSAAALTRYCAGERLPTTEVFVYSVLLMERDLRDYVAVQPTRAA